MLDDLRLYNAISNWVRSPSNHHSIGVQNAPSFGEFYVFLPTERWNAKPIETLLCLLASDPALQPIPLSSCEACHGTGISKGSPPFPNRKDALAAAQKTLRRGRQPSVLQQDQASPISGLSCSTWYLSCSTCDWMPLPRLILRSRPTGYRGPTKDFPIYEKEIQREGAASPPLLRDRLSVVADHLQTLGGPPALLGFDLTMWLSGAEEDQLIYSAALPRFSPP